MQLELAFCGEVYIEFRAITLVGLPLLVCLVYLAYDFAFLVFSARPTVLGESGFFEFGPSAAFEVSLSESAV